MKRFYADDYRELDASRLYSSHTSASFYQGSLYSRLERKVPSHCYGGKSKGVERRMMQ